MNTTITRASRRHFPYLPLMAALILAVILGGCSKSNEQVTLDLLATVPADAETVAVCNLNTLVRQTGGKVKDGHLEQADNLKKAFAQMAATLGDSTASTRRLDVLFSPDSGVECESMVIFLSKGVAYASGMLYDTEKFMQAVRTACGGEWSEDGKMKVNDDYVILGDRFWTCPPSGREMVTKFTNLSEVESFRSNAYAPEISKATDALVTWSSIDGLMRATGMSFSQQTTARMALGMFFNSPKSLAGAMNVTDDNTLAASLRVLDADLKPAKCELAVSKIDTKVLEDFGGNANFVFAAAVSQKLIRQLMDLAGSFGGQMPQAYASALEPIDGTVAFAANMEASGLNNFTGLGFKGAIQTSGKNNARLLQVLEPLVGKVTIEGDTFLFGNEGYGSGVAPMSDVAKDMTGAWLGVAGAWSFNDRPPHYYFAATLVPAENSLMLKLKMDLK
ncbi:MAG: hypothetical protein K2F87_01705 [Muribaculaceae bacterium]|nr:hypothetical protein [Muribaculaceae bacterium]